MAAKMESLLASADEEQVRMMEERVIVVDYNDKPIGNGSKKETHIMTSINAGLLHRAFSVFLFTPDGRLILQQRSGAKITFPYIWANTCCSHPLDVPSETIEEDAKGVKNAARRKLEHELGILPEDVPYESFTWLTRVHYAGQSIAPEKPVAGSHTSPGSDVPGCAATAEPVDSHASAAAANGALKSLAKAPTSVWGEHEIDWILMCKPEKMPRLALNSNEVAAVRCFTQAELKEWMRTRHERGEEVSPWFGLMEQSGLVYRWWDAVLGRNGLHLGHPEILQTAVIHRQHDLEKLATKSQKVQLQPALACSEALTDEGRAPTAASFSLKAISPASASAALKAGAGPSSSQNTVTVTAVPKSAKSRVSSAAPKQGAYGKVKVHTESLRSQLSHLDEVWAALCFKLGVGKSNPKRLVAPLPNDASESSRFCDDMLVKVSRSFAMVIQQLPPHLRTGITVFYLVLRGLDTVEDDMEAFAGNQAQKLLHLRQFYRYLEDKHFRMKGVGEGDEATLLENFVHVNEVFLGLPSVDRTVIADICKRMGEGMADFAGRDLREGTADDSDYALYCHYVAGLVGEGLSRLFVAHGDEAPVVAEDIKLADDMGAFLQKTNIIRDYLEDLVEGRAFWPRSIWSLYSPGLANLRHKVDAFRNLAAKGEKGKPLVDAALEENKARACLNHLIADAMTLAPSCLRYMSRLRTPAVFRFCAIPQLMAIATLDKLTNNADVFTGVVKIRKGQALVLLNAASSMEDVYSIFLEHALSIRSKIPTDASGPHAAAKRIIDDAVEQIAAICSSELAKARPLGLTATPSSPFRALTVVGFSALVLLLFRGASGPFAAVVAFLLVLCFWLFGGPPKAVPRVEEEELPAPSSAAPTSSKRRSASKGAKRE